MKMKVKRQSIGKKWVDCIELCYQKANDPFLVGLVQHWICFD